MQDRAKDVTRFFLRRDGLKRSRFGLSSSFTAKNSGPAFDGERGASREEPRPAAAGRLRRRGGGAAGIVAGAARWCGV